MNILCVCTGNICRSPMLEAMLRDELQKQNVSNVCVSSAGIATYDGAPASEHAITVMNENGLDVSAHRSRQVTTDIVKENDVFVALSPEHGVALAFQFGADPEKVITVGAGIPDPYGGNLAVYRACRKALAEALPQLILDLNVL